MSETKLYKFIYQASKWLPYERLLLLQAYVRYKEELLCCKEKDEVWNKIAKEVIQGRQCLKEKSERSKSKNTFITGSECMHEIKVLRFHYHVYKCMIHKKNKRILNKQLRRFFKTARNAFGRTRNSGSSSSILPPNNTSTSIPDSSVHVQRQASVVSSCMDISRISTNHYNSFTSVPLPSKLSPGFSSIASSEKKTVIPARKKLGHEIGKAAAEGSRGLFSAVDWKCGRCGNVNWARRQQCNMCNAPKFVEVEERTGSSPSILLPNNTSSIIPDSPAHVQRRASVESSSMDISQISTHQFNSSTSEISVPLPSKLSPGFSSIASSEKKTAIPARKKLGHEIGKAAAEESGGLFSAVDWRCGRCGNVNWARRQQCHMCNAPKFGEVKERTGVHSDSNDDEVLLNLMFQNSEWLPEDCILLLQVSAKYRTVLYYHGSTKKRHKVWGKIAAEVFQKINSSSTSPTRCYSPASWIECKCETENLRLQYKLHKKDLLLSEKMKKFFDTVFGYLVPETAPTEGSSDASLPNLKWTVRMHLKLLGLYSKYKTELLSTLLNKQSVWEKIAKELELFSQQQCSAKQCSDELHNLKCDYEKNKDTYIAELGLVRAVFLDTAEKVFENVENPGDYSMSPDPKSLHLNRDHHQQLLQLYTKYKGELSLQNFAESQIAWQKVSRELSEKCGFFYGKRQCYSEIYNMTDLYECVKNNNLENLLNFDAKYFFDEAKEFFESAKCTDVPLHHSNASAVVQESVDQDIHEDFNSTSSLPPSNVNSNTSDLSMFAERQASVISDTMDTLEPLKKKLCASVDVEIDASVPKSLLGSPNLTLADDKESLSSTLPPCSNLASSSIPDLSTLAQKQTSVESCNMDASEPHIHDASSPKSPSVVSNCADHDSSATRSPEMIGLTEQFSNPLASGTSLEATMPSEPLPAVQNLSSIDKPLSSTLPPCSSHASSSIPDLSMLAQKQTSVESCNMDTSEPHIHDASSPKSPSVASNSANHDSSATRSPEMIGLTEQFSNPLASGTSLEAPLPPEPLTEVPSISSIDDDTLTLPILHSQVKQSSCTTPGNVIAQSSLSPASSNISLDEENMPFCPSTIRVDHASVLPENIITTSGSGNDGQKDEKDVFSQDSTVMKDDTQTLPVLHSQVKQSSCTSLGNVIAQSSLPPSSSSNISLDKENLPFCPSTIHVDHPSVLPQNNVTTSGSGNDGQKNEKDVSSQNCSAMKDLPEWLKSLRLLKYSYIFKNMTYEEMMSITEEKLERINITKGARHKIILNIQKLSERQESLRSLEKDLQNGKGQVKCALKELKAIIQTPIKAFTDSSALSDSVNENEPENLGSPNSPPSPTTHDGDTLSHVPEGDLPGQIMHLLGKICSTLLVSPNQDEDMNLFVMIIDKCHEHEAFTPTQKQKLFSWKRHVQKAYPNSTSQTTRRNRSSGVIKRPNL